MQLNFFHPEISSNQNILPHHGNVTYFPEVFDSVQSENFLNSLTEEINWKQEPIKIMGKEIMQPRLTAWYGNPDKPYRYSGITMDAWPWNDTLLKIKKEVDRIAGISFTSALLNYYRNGEDSMGWHRDNEKELGRNPVIASVTFGALRKFQFREYADKKNLISMELGSGSVLIMQGETNHFWEHRIPKTKSVQKARINLTFRVIN